MIIMKIIILFVIKIRHTDDFPSTGTRLGIIIEIKTEVGKNDDTVLITHKKVFKQDEFLRMI